MKFKPLKNNLDKLVFAISFISLIWISLYKIIFLAKNELFPYASDIGDIFYSILSSVVASGIFYYFVVYLDRRRKEKIIHKIVQKKLGSIAVGLFIIKKDVFPIFGLTYKDEIPEFDEFVRICRGLNLRDKAPNIPNTTEEPIIWYDYFNYFFQSDRYNSQLLYEHIIYLDIELVELLDEIQYSDFQRALDSFRTNEYTHEIAGTPGPFWNYLKSLEKISKYSTKINEKKNNR